MPDPAGIDPEALAASLHVLREQGSEDPSAALAVTVEAAHTLFGMTGAGLMLLDDAHVLRHVGASNALSEELERAQEEVGDGPCVRSLVMDVAVRSPDLAGDDRWPALSQRLAGAVGAVLGVPVRLQGAPVGSLNVFSDRPHAWDDSEVRALLAYSGVVEQLLLALLSARSAGDLAGQLQRALDSRVLIDRATGFLMARLDMDAVRAFDALRRSARSSNRRTAQVAAQVLAGELP